MEHVPNLKCIICGFEHGGTTVLSELVRQHPRVDGRFEIGFLLDRHISRFYRPDNVFVDFVESFWGVPREQIRDYICGAPDWREAYRRLAECSVVADDALLYDKTPRYMSYLKKILKKVDSPCLALVRDPRALYASALKQCLTELLIGG